MTRIGTFNKTHGHDGEINLTVEVPFDYDECRFIFVNVDGLPVPFEVKSVRERNDDTLLVSFERMDTDHLQMLVKQEAFVDDEYVDTDDEEMNAAYYVGHELVTENLDFIGEITDYDDSTENILFAIKDKDGNEHYIPAAAIEIIEISGKQIRCSLPEGLLEL